MMYLLVQKSVFTKNFIKAKQHTKCGAANTHLRKKDTRTEPNGKQTSTQRPRRDIWYRVYFEIV